jgi:hypothetical protein
MATIDSDSISKKFETVLELFYKNHVTFSLWSSWSDDTDAITLNKMSQKTRFGISDLYGNLNCSSNFG